jgi:hypothetical protein
MTPISEKSLEAFSGELRGGERPQSQQVDRGRAEQKPDQDFAEDCGPALAHTHSSGGLRREDDGYEEQEGLWQVGHVTA